jgi:hypothetical protein
MRGEAEETADPSPGATAAVSRDDNDVREESFRVPNWRCRGALETSFGGREAGPPAGLAGVGSGWSGARDSVEGSE